MVLVYHLADYSLEAIEVATDVAEENLACKAAVFATDVECYGDGDGNGNGRSYGYGDGYGCGIPGDNSDD